MRNQTFLLRNLLVYVTCILTFGASAQTQIDYKNLARQIFSGEQDQFHVQGIAFDPVKAERKDLEFEKLDQGGMGIMAARMNSREMIYNRIDGRNVLTMVFDADDI